MSKKKVDFSLEVINKVAEAVNLILEGNCSRVEIYDTVKVYGCKNVIRIDLKVTEKN